MGNFAFSPSIEKGWGKLESFGRGSGKASLTACYKLNKVFLPFKVPLWNWLALGLEFLGNNLMNIIFIYCTFYFFYYKLLEFYIFKFSTQWKTLITTPKFLLVYFLTKLNILLFSGFAPRPPPPPKIKFLALPLDISASLK